jgi:hypothetical protein
VKKLYLVLPLLVVLISGCASMKSKNTQFSFAKPVNGKPSQTIMICRPQSIMATFSDVGVMINGAPAFDLGNNESWNIQLPPQDSQQFKFVIPPYDRTVDLRVPSSNGKTYIVFTISLDQFYVLVAIHKWQAKIVDEATFKQECPNPKALDLTHNSL